MKVGITGQAGFLGTHLAAAVEAAADLELVPFEDAFFADDAKLRAFVKSCDVIMHFAGASRMPSEDELYKTNMGLVTKLIAAMDAEGVAPHVLFSSSTHETRDTAYGRAKRDGRTMLAQWAESHGVPFTGFIFPNVYGPGARVHYASFIANFAWELQHGEEPKILVDAPIRLIYVENLMKIILGKIRKPDGIERFEVPWDFEKKVSEILSLFRGFAANGLPAGASEDERNLYSTFEAYK